MDPKTEFRNFINEFNSVVPGMTSLSEFLRLVDVHELYEKEKIIINAFIQHPAASKDLLQVFLKMVQSDDRVEITEQHISVLEAIRDVTQEELKAKEVVNPSEKKQMLAELNVAIAMLEIKRKYQDLNWESSAFDNAGQKAWILEDFYKQVQGAFNSYLQGEDPQGQKLEKAAHSISKENKKILSEFRWSIKPLINGLIQVVTSLFKLITPVTEKKLRTESDSLVGQTKDALKALKEQGKDKDYKPPQSPSRR